jgi:hypothetical protein
MALDRLNPALRWFAALCLAGFIVGGCLRYILLQDIHLATNARLGPVAVATESSPELSASQPSVVVAPTPISQPPPSQQVATVQQADAHPLPPLPDQPLTSPPPAQPAPLAAPSRPLEKVSACVMGDPELRDLFTADLLQSMTGKIVSGDCSAVEGPVVVVSGLASKLATSDPACRTVDGHLYEVFVSISWPGSSSAIGRTISAARCSSRIRNEDTALGREAKNQAVLQGITSLHGLLKRLSEN